MSQQDPREEVEIEVKRANGAPGVTIIDTRIILRSTTQTIDQLIAKAKEFENELSKK